MVSLYNGAQASVHVYVHPSVHTFKHEYLWDQQANQSKEEGKDQESNLIWSIIAVGKDYIRFSARSDYNSDIHGNR